MDSDLELAFRCADAADAETRRCWSPHGVAARLKSDGTPVTEADIAAEQAVRALVASARPGDGFVGEEVGESTGSTGRRWIVDGIDGTRFFAAGRSTWGTLIALEEDGEIVVGVSSSPAQDRRWWATRGGGAFTGLSERRFGSRQIRVRQIRVSSVSQLRPDRVVTLPAHDKLDPGHRALVEQIAGGAPIDVAWSHQNRVAEGEVDLCIWLAGDIWDHAAPSILVEEAGGRFSDHRGGRRLDTRTAVYSNGVDHDDIVALLAEVA